jgi:hypothetical protein
MTHPHKRKRHTAQPDSSHRPDRGQAGKAGGGAACAEARGRGERPERRAQPRPRPELAQGRTGAKLRGHAVGQTLYAMGGRYGGDTPPLRGEGVTRKGHNGGGHLPPGTDGKHNEETKPTAHTARACPRSARRAIRRGAQTGAARNCSDQRERPPH